MLPGLNGFSLNIYNDMNQQDYQDIIITILIPNLIKQIYSNVTNLQFLNNISLVNVTINGKQSSISSYSNIKFTINYPPNDPDTDYVLIIIVDGYRAESSVDLIDPSIPTPTPTSTSTSTPSKTPTVTPTPTSTPTETLIPVS
ncbi:hypothetical protein ACTA71_003949 [Dictyostelium dimigraforme]